MRETQPLHGSSSPWASIAALAAIVIAAAPAHAEPVILVVTGNAEQGTRDQVGVIASATVGTSSWKLVTPGPTARQAAALEACIRERAHADCAKILTSNKAKRGLVLRVDRSADPTAPITLTGYLLGADGTVVATEQRFCESTEIAELERHAGELLEALVGGQAGAGKRTVLVIRSRPAQARVMVDNEPVGVTPMDYGVVPGPHKISLDKAGYEIEVRQVEAPAGTTQTVDVVLRPILGHDAAPAVSPRRKASRWPGRLTLAAGLAAIGAGVALVLLDASGQSSSPRDPDGAEKRFQRSSMLPGIIAGGAGVVVAGTGIYLLVRAGRADRESARTAGAGNEPIVGLGLTRSF